MDEAEYEIVETRYNPRAKTTLQFKGNLEEASKKADELARQNIGTRYNVFRVNGPVAEYQAYFSTSITCPKCGEVIPLE